jgi:Predicted hydrolase (HAD superfamily)
MNTFIFDLDGTLLPMPSQDKFVDAYIRALSGKLISCGMDSKLLIKAIMSGTQQMISNDGSITNEECFWKEFCRLAGSDARKLEVIFDEFYRNEFSMAKVTTSAHPLARQCIKLLKEKGYHIALATNPLFPKIATENRVLWAGLDPVDFELITTYEVSSYCKPNLEYYKEVLTLIGKEAKECIMVGNDVTEDMCAAMLGMDTFLLKDCLICPEGADITGLQQGSFRELLDLIRKLPVLV